MVNKIKSKLPKSPRLTTRAQLEHVTQEMYKKNLELAETNRTLQLLKEIDELVLHPEEDLYSGIRKITQTILNHSPFQLVSIFLLEGNSFREVSTEMEIIEGELEVKKFRDEMRDTTIKAHSLADFLNNRLDTEKDIEKSYYQKLLSGKNIENFQALKIINFIGICPMTTNGKPIGLLVLGSIKSAEDLSEFERSLIDRLKGTVNIALENKILYKKNIEATEELKDKNRKLKELDQAKDEFISMASHQLRTPLTTVKGYLSMMLEGDTGKLTKEQSKVADAAFFSAERMVSLITDLLNVSRMNTGKFVIEPSEIDMIKMIKEEAKQLENVAKNRKVNLQVELPEECPTVWLDDNKIRQVIMNFADNAIYYTPENGTVTISLVVDSDKLELRVKDTGIGVPEAEKKNLFTKFYRATNAKDQRPDGTGLGLFMAKKVISAQGGTIVFESKQGQGSTFGFRFSLAVIGSPPKKHQLAEDLDKEKAPA